MPIAFFKISISSLSCAFLFNNFLYSADVIVVFSSKVIGWFFFTHVVIVDFATAYSLLNSDKLFPALYSSTIVFLNSSVYYF